MPPQITCVSALHGKRGNTKITFSLKCCINRERCKSWTLLHAQRILKEKLSSLVCMIASTFVEIVRYPINTAHWVSLRLNEEQIPSFTQRPTPWQTWLTHSMWATDSRILDPVWCIQLIVLTVKGGSAVTKWYFNVFCVFLVKSMQHLSEKMQFSLFLFPR